MNTDGSVNTVHLEMIDKALRSYFMMNRGNRMGQGEQFVPRLARILSNDKIRHTMVILRNVTILSPDLQDCRLSSEDLYEALTNRQHGVSADHTYFRVGSTKLMHMLFPEFFVMLDKNVGKACGYPTGQYNNFDAYWKVMNICRNELIEWSDSYGSLDTLLRLAQTPTSLTRIFDKCATVIGAGLV